MRVIELNFKIIEKPTDNFEEIYPTFRELLNTTNLTVCEVLKKCNIACTNNSMARKLKKAYNNESEIDLKHRKAKVQYGVWL